MIWPQVVMIALFAVRVTNRTHRDGTPKAFVGHAIAAAFDAGILYFGGFWTPLGLGR